METYCNRDDDSRTGDRIFATFLIDDLEFAIDVAQVRDAIPVPEHIVRLPASPDYLAGIMDLRGTILPLIDTRKRFLIPEPSEKFKGHIAVIHCQGRTMGLFFDRIKEIVRVSADSIVSLPPEFQVEGRLLQRIINLENGRRLIQVIDPSALFDYQDLPAELRRETEHRQSAVACSPRRKIVAFQLAGHPFGIAVEDIREIITVPEINQNIVVEHYIKGLICHRHELISVIDLGAFLGAEPIRVENESRILILNLDGFCFGILVSGISEVITFEEQLLRPMPAWLGDKHEGGFAGALEWESGDIVILDSRKIFGQAIKRLIEHTALHQEKGQETALTESTESGRTKDVSPARTYITFDLGEVYGADISYIREIVRFEDNIRHLPGQAAYIEGILNLRSEVIPVVNLRKYFKETPPESPEQLIVIFTHDGRQLGVMVDRLREIKTIYSDAQGGLPLHLYDHDNPCCDELIDRVVELTKEDGRNISTMILDIPKFMERAASANT